jgi:hypothetical protein
MLHLRSDPAANSIAVTVWHMGRLMDVFLTQHVEGKPTDKECWIRNGWAERTGYDPCGLGSNDWGAVVGFTQEQVAEIPRFTQEQLLGYLNDVTDGFTSYVQNTPMEDLAEAAEGFDGHYTKYQVLSMALLDNVRHLGEIYALKGMWVGKSTSPGPGVMATASLGVHQADGNGTRSDRPVLQALEESGRAKDTFLCSTTTATTEEPVDL